MPAKTMYALPEEQGKYVLFMPILPARMADAGMQPGYYTYNPQAEYADSLEYWYMAHADKAWYVEQGDWVIIKDRLEGFSECPDLSLDNVDKAQILLEAQEV